MAGSREWPDGWSRGERPPSRPPADSDRTQVLPPELSPRGTGVPRRTDVSEAPPRRGAHPPPAFTTPRRRKAGAGPWTRRALLALLLVLALVAGLLLYFYSRIGKVDALRDYPGRPAAASGTNWLIVGSDSREGLSDAQIKKLHLGKVGGQRTDTIILLHKPSSGQPTLVSLPRDSYVPIPGHGKNKLNAAFAFGGPALLVRTVEQATGLRVDHYAEIGFGGFVGVTDAVGGVTLCPTRDITDEKSGLNVKKGCQSMNGPTSLAYVRARYFDPKGDLGRVQRQQQYLSAVFHAALSPGVLLNPFRVVRLANAGTKALAVDKGDGTFDLIRLFLVMRSISGGHGKSVTVPVSDPAYQTPAGDAVKWDSEKARALFHSLT